MQRIIHLLFIIFLLNGCGQEQRDAPRSQIPGAEGVAIPPAESLATIIGTAFLDGTPPRMSELSMGADRKCAALHDHPVHFEQVMVGSGSVLQNVFVYIKQGLEERVFALPKDTVVINQQGCVYKPHVIGMQVNQPLLIVNSDPTLHNIHAMPQINRGFNIAQPRRGMKTERTFTRQEVMIRVKCDVHPWMASYIGVLSHPYYAVSGSDGSGTLGSIPPGEYVVAAWHERYGEQEQRVTVSPGSLKKLEFRFKEGS